ncbi:ilvBHC operon leader peptide [Actinoplanes sp. SE50/110]|nr:ilvBHC operon leader peptide [Actinoplanes sp. SE50/110]
MCFASRVLL